MIEHLSANVVAQKFGYKVNTIYSLVSRAKAGRLKLFPEVAKGPQQRHTAPAIQQQIVQLRKQNLAAADIHQILTDEGHSISVRTIERILKQAGFKKLKRCTHSPLWR
jgi:transposase